MSDPLARLAGFGGARVGGSLAAAAGASFATAGASLAVQSLRMVAAESLLELRRRARRRISGLGFNVNLKGGEGAGEVRSRDRRFRRPVKAFGARIVSDTSMSTEQFSSPAGRGWWSMGVRRAREATLVGLRGRGAERVPSQEQKFCHTFTPAEKSRAHV